MDNVKLARELRRLEGIEEWDNESRGVLRDAAERLETDATVLEEYAEIDRETSVGLAWAAGDSEPPKTCTEDCRSPHLGPRAHQAIKDGLRALREGAWNPPRREGS